MAGVCLTLGSVAFEKGRLAPLDSGSIVGCAVSHCPPICNFRSKSDGDPDAKHTAPLILLPGIINRYLSGTHILPVAYLAIVPGIVGHQGLNTALKYISPLAISLTTAMEPVIGAMIVGHNPHIAQHAVLAF